MGPYRNPHPGLWRRPLPSLVLWALFLIVKLLGQLPLLVFAGANKLALLRRANVQQIFF
jgi:hypothetical protein